MNVSLTSELERYVREKVGSGLYNSASEVVREALRLLVAQDRDESSHRAEADEGRAPHLAARPPAAAHTTERDPASLRVASARLRQALDMLHLSYALMKQNLRRKDTTASEAEIEVRLAVWRSDADWGEEAPGYLERSPERLARLRRAHD